MVVKKYQAVKRPLPAINQLRDGSKVVEHLSVKDKSLEESWPKNFKTKPDPGQNLRGDAKFSEGVLMASPGSGHPATAH